MARRSNVSGWANECGQSGGKVPTLRTLSVGTLSAKCGQLTSQVWAALGWGSQEQVRGLGSLLFGSLSRANESGACTLFRMQAPLDGWGAMRVLAYPSGRLSRS